MFWIYQNASFTFRTHLEPGSLTSLSCYTRQAHCGLFFRWLQYTPGFSLSFPYDGLSAQHPVVLRLWSVWSWGGFLAFSWVKSKALRSAPSLTTMAWPSFQGAACRLPPHLLLYFDLFSQKQCPSPHCRAEMQKPSHLTWTPFFLKISQLTPVSLSSLSSNLPLSKRLILTNPFCLRNCPSVTLFCFSFTYSNLSFSPLHAFLLTQ